MVSLIDALDAIEVAGELPAIDESNPAHIGPVSIRLVIFWYRSVLDKPETGTCRIKFIAPNGKMYGPEKAEFEVNLVGNSAVHTIVNVEAIPYLGFGTYYFEIEAKEQDANSWLGVAKLPVQLKSPPS